MCRFALFITDSLIQKIYVAVILLEMWILDLHVNTSTIYRCPQNFKVTSSIISVTSLLFIVAKCENQQTKFNLKIDTNKLTCHNARVIPANTCNALQYSYSKYHLVTGLLIQLCHFVYTPDVSIVGVNYHCQP